MIQSFQSSGDIVADRRAAYAQACAEARDFAGAGEAMTQALELAPRWAAGWNLLGQYLEEVGDIAGAADAWRQLVLLDPRGIFGGRLKLAAHGAGPAIETTQSGYVEALFDDYAPRFETALVERLGYAAPQQLAEMIEAELGKRGAGRIGRAVDLGCGTGLMGQRLRGLVERIEGVDLSGRMLAEARRKGVYDELERAEIEAFLAGHAGGVDLITAADVLNYCGSLAPIFVGVARVLGPSGLFAFTLEAHEGPEPMLLRPSLRFAHRPDAAEAALEATGLEVLRLEHIVLRHDRGAPVAGVLVLAGHAVETRWRPEPRAA